jgi:hypothetical protein
MREGGKQRISIDGGVTAKWRHDGKELFYIAADATLMAVPIGLPADGQTVTLGAAVPLFRTHLVGGGEGLDPPQYVVARDGQRFLMNAVPIGGASLVMFAGQSEESRKASWKFIKWLTTPETLGGWSRFTGYFAPRKSAYDKSEMKEFIAKNPDAKVALDQLPYAKPWFATYQTVAVRKALEDEIQAMMNGKKKADQAVKDAQKKADELMRPYVEQTSLKLP